MLKNQKQTKVFRPIHCGDDTHTLTVEKFVSVLCGKVGVGPVAAESIVANSKPGEVIEYSGITYRVEVSC